MPAFQKRVVNNAEFPEAKKAKVVGESDAVLAKVGTIVAAVQNENFVVPGTNTNREMLAAIAPGVLATPVDARHPHQQTLAADFKELFVNEESRLTEQVTEGQVKVTEVTKEMTTRKGAVATAESALKDKSDELKAKQFELAEKVNVTRNAESMLQEVTSEISDLEQTQGFEKEEQETAKNLNTEHFLVLKEGSWEGDIAPKDHVKPLQSFFRSLKADASMVAALPVGLGRKPAERSEFDNMVVSELEKKMEDKLSTLAEQVKTNDEAIAVKKAEKEAAESAVADAKATQRCSAEALLALKAEQKQCTAALSEKKQAVIEHEYEVQTLEADYNERKIGLEAHQKILSDLNELLERCTPVVEVPEEQAEVAAEESVAEAAMDLVIEPAQEVVA